MVKENKVIIFTGIKSDMASFFLLNKFEFPRIEFESKDNFENKHIDSHVTLFNILPTNNNLGYFMKFSRVIVVDLINGADYEQIITLDTKVKGSTRVKINYSNDLELEEKLIILVEKLRESNSENSARAINSINSINSINHTLPEEIFLSDDFRPSDAEDIELLIKSETEAVKYKEEVRTEFFLKRTKIINEVRERDQSVKEMYDEVSNKIYLSLKRRIDEEYEKNTDLRKKAKLLESQLGELGDL